MSSFLFFSQKLSFDWIQKILAVARNYSLLNLDDGVDDPCAAP